MLEFLKNTPTEYMDCIFTTPEKIERCYKAACNGDSYIMDVEITPEIAKHILENHSYKFNRKPVPSHINFFKKLIKDEAYDHRAGTFEFNEKRELINGQHRMTAIAASKKSIYATIKTNIPHDVFFKIDNGRKRNITQLFFMSGQFDNPFESQCVQLLTVPLHVLYKYKSLKLTSTGGVKSGQIPSEEALFNFYKSHLINEGLEESIKLTINRVPDFPVKNAHLDTQGKILLYYFILSKVIPNDYHYVLDMIFVEKSNIANNTSCLYGLRKWLDDNRISKRNSISRKEKYETIMKILYWICIGETNRKFKDWSSATITEIRDENDVVVKKVKVTHKEASLNLMDLYLDIVSGKKEPMMIDRSLLESAKAKTQQNADSIAF